MPEPVPVYRRALRYFRPFLRETSAGLALALAVIGLNLLKPWPFKFIIDDVLPRRADPSPALAHLAAWTPEAQVAALCSALVALHLAAGWLNLAQNVMLIRIGLQALLKLRTDLYACLHGLPLQFHDQRRSADSSFRVAYDSQAIQTIYNKGTGVLGSLISLVATLGVMFAMDWKLTLLGLVIVPPIMFAIRFYSGRVRSESTTIQERESAVLTAAQEGLASVRMVQAFGREAFEVEQLRERAQQSVNANLRLTRTTMQSALVVSLLMIAGTALLYWVGSLHVLRAELTLGELIVLSTYLASLYQPIEALTYTAWALEGAAAGAQRCFEVLDREEETRDAPGATPLPECRGEIAFERVGFAYRDDRTILRDVDLRVEPGQRFAFVGGTGAGKTTLLSLVPRFYDPTSGRVTLDGRDLREITRASLRQHISIVLQDTLLFSTSIRENIAYGRPEASEEEIVEAARRAQAHDFIAALPDGYSSQVGERGGHLSVGQRQRIGIARAFLKNAPILLLDEPTSALDPTTEAAIMGTLDTLMRGRTTLIITHRIATVHHLDRIAVLAGGTVAEVGSGADLLARGGAYAALWNAAQSRPAES
jgi:ATP-binding cassette subfamily B protein/subfamily B ATP-binding cassette protein MsbA